MDKQIFEPARIGTLQLKNRIIMLPMGDGMQTVTGGISERQIRYFAERAKNDVGLIIQAVCPRNSLNIHGWNSDFDREEKISMMDTLTRTIHSYGTKIGVMLGLSLGHIVRAHDGSLPRSASAIPLADGSGSSIPLTSDEIYQLIEDYGYSAHLAQLGGYDLIHIQGYGGYFIDQFMTELWNRRTDEFGGSFEKRMRFPLALIDSIQRHCGNDYPIIFKMTPDHLIENGRKLEEGLEIARVLEKAGVAALHIDVGNFESRVYELIPPVYQRSRAKQFSYAGKIKEVVSIPVYTQGKVGNPEDAFAVYAEGLTDFVALGRSFLADPAWAVKARNGDYEDICPCICCNDGCIVRLEQLNTIACAVNPECGIEGLRALGETRRKAKILIVGAGPAGCAAAVFAARCGHSVEIVEKDAKIGGALLAASAPVFKSEMRRLIRYYETQLRKSENITLKLNNYADKAYILSSEADYIIFANGGKEVTLNNQLFGNLTKALACDVLSGKICPEGPVVIIGGGYAGCETAVFLAEKKLEVSLIEQYTILNSQASRQTESMMRKMIADSTITIYEDGQFVSANNDKALLMQKDGSSKEINCGSIVLALGSKPDNTLYSELVGHRPCTIIGDAKHPHNVLNAVWDAYAAVSAI